MSHVWWNCWPLPLPSYTWLALLFPALSEGKQGDYEMVSAHPSVRTAYNSTTTGPIHSKSSSLEPPRPLDVQRSLAHWGHIGGWICNKGFWNLADAGNSNHGADSLQIKFFGTVLACRCATQGMKPLKCLQNNLGQLIYSAKNNFEIIIISHSVFW